MQIKREKPSQANWKFSQSMNKFSIFLLTCITAFHIPDFKVDSKIDVDGSSHNSGMIHSTIRQNRSQSLNVGSVIIAATLVILFIALIMYLRIQEIINGLVKCVKQLQNDFKQASKQRNRPHRKPTVAQSIQERIWDWTACVILNLKNACVTKLKSKWLWIPSTARLPNVSNLN